MTSQTDVSEDLREEQPVLADESLIPRGMVFQVSMRSLLLATAGLAFLIAAVFAFPPVLSALIAIALAVIAPAMLVICIIYGRSRVRAFAIGMLTPLVMRMVNGSSLSSSLEMTIARSQAWQSSRSSSTESPGYFAQLVEAWDQTGHAMMAEEAIYLGASALAGFAAMVMHRQLAHATPRRRLSKTDVAN